MEFSCHVDRSPSGGWVVRHSGSNVGAVDVSAPTREAAIEKMRRELQYRLEWCPCTGEMAQHVEIKIVER